jgi:hypothetical protein
VTGEELAAACDALTERPERPTVPEMLPLVNAYYRMPGCGAGGAVHVMLEDLNIEQSHADWCVENAEGWGQSWGARDGGPHHLAVARLLRRASRTQRGKLATVHEYPWEAQR